MAFPQPSSSEYVASGADFFRLFTPLACPGDMYESEQSGLAMSLGPQSDIANVNIAYFDPQAPNFMQFAQINQARSVVGRIDANNLGKYAPAQRPGRVLIWPGDIYDPNFHPHAFTPNDTISFVTPVLDVIQYFNSPPGALVPARVDKVYEFQNYQLGVGTFYMVIPYYGRKYAYINFTNRDQVVPNTFGIIGVNYAITQNIPASLAYHQETVIRAPAAVAANASVTVRVTAGSSGMFDALVFSVTSSGPAPLRIVVSDESQGT